MNTNQKYLAQLIFKNKVYSSEGQTFEDFFSSIMMKSNPNFMQVKAYGRIGDRKNDGFDKTTGEYFQVFAPQDIHNSSTINDATTKLESDFKGLYDFWNDKYPIKKYNFVVNDKYKGVPPPLYDKISELEGVYTDVEFNIFTAAKLEDIVLNMDIDAVNSILGYIVDIHTAQLEYSALTEVIEHLMRMNDSSDSDNLLSVPDFEEKIVFNKLSDKVANMLRSASYQVGGLEAYFRCHSEVTKSEVQRKIVDCYKNAATLIDKTIDNYADLVFMKILDDIYPNGNVSIRNAIMILMAYYFESCDIFEKPEREVVI